VKVAVAFAFLSLSAATLAFPADVFRFRADRMTGGSASGKKLTILSGAAEVVSDDLVLQADRIELSGDDNRFVDCSGSVSGTDEKKGIHFRSERLRYDRELKIARLEGDSTLEDKENSVVAKGRFIEYNDEAGTTILQVGVRIFKDELVCRSEYALYRRKEKLLELTGLPVVFREGDEFRSDRMKVDLETDDITMEGAVTGSLKGKEKPKEEGAAAEGEATGDKVKADATSPSTEAATGHAVSADSASPGTAPATTESAETKKDPKNTEPADVKR
jgi:lipopolysaccharide export system protein LptA